MIGEWERGRERSGKRGEEVGELKRGGEGTGECKG